MATGKIVNIFLGHYARQLQLQLFSVFCLTTNRYCISNIIVMFSISIFLFFSYPLITIHFQTPKFQSRFTVVRSRLLASLASSTLALSQTYDSRVSQLTPSKSNPLTTAAVSSPTRSPNAALQQCTTHSAAADYRSIEPFHSSRRRLALAVLVEEYIVLLLLRL